MIVGGNSLQSYQDLKNPATILICERRTSDTNKTNLVRARQESGLVRNSLNTAKFYG